MAQPPDDDAASTEQSMKAALSLLDQAHYQALIAATGQVIWICAPTGCLMHDMTSWCAFTGQTPQAAVANGWLAALHRDDHDAAALAWGEAVRHREVYMHECRVRRADDTYRDMLVRAVPVLATGAGDEWICACADITDRKRLEHQNRAALAVLLRVEQIVTEPAMRVDVGFLLSRVAEALWNLTAVDFAHAMQVTAPDRLEPLAMYGVAANVVADWQARVRAFDALATPRSAELLAHLSAGHLLVQRFDVEAPIISPLVVSAYQIRAAITVPVLVQEQLIGLLTVSRVRPLDPGDADFFAPWDLDLLTGVGRLTGAALTRTRLVEQLTVAEAAQMAAEATTRQHDEFLSIASHELRTPLTSIAANVQLLRRDAHDLLPELVDTPVVARVERIETLAQRADRQVRRLNRLVDDLLDISRIAAGKLELRRADCDLLALVAEAVLDQRDAWPGRAIMLELPPLAALMLSVDADRLGQVVTNLLTNALKYSAADQDVVVRVSIEADAVRVAVSDHGPGIASKYQEHLFRQFYRVPTITLRSGSGVGLGLGLYICKTIVAHHGGAIGVTSTVGQGSTFWFTLPLADVSQPLAQEAP